MTQQANEKLLGGLIGTSGVSPSLGPGRWGDGMGRWVPCLLQGRPPEMRGTAEWRHGERLRADTLFRLPNCRAQQANTVTAHRVQSPRAPRSPRRGGVEAQGGQAPEVTIPGGPFIGALGLL